MAEKIQHILRTPISPKVNNAPATGKLHSGDNAFGSLLQEKISQVSGLKFSAHALDRLRQRKLEVSTQELEKLSEATTKAAKKGAKDTLFLMNDKAFLVNIKNRVVVTAMDQAKLKEDIFTNIDSVALIPTDSEEKTNSGQDLHGLRDQHLRPQ